MNADIIRNLSLSHGALLESLNEVQPLARSYREAKPKLRELYRRLILFFGSEDGAFFEKLYAFYNEDRSSTKMIDFLKQDLSQIKISFLAFFDAHSVETVDAHARSFPRDLADFAGQILGRIRIEEEHLFPLLQKMSAANPPGSRWQTNSFLL